MISLAMTGSWINSRVIDTSPEKPVSGFGVWSYFSEFYVYPIESVVEDNIDRASRVSEHYPDFQVSHDEIYDEWIAVRLIDSTGFLLREGDRAVLTVSGRRPRRPVCT